MKSDLMIGATSVARTQSLSAEAPLQTPPMRRRVLLFLSAAMTAAVPAFDAQARPRAGDRLPMIDTVLLDGALLPARSLRGKVVVHMFWATWCPLCREDLPRMQRLYEDFRERGLEIVALSVDQNRAEVERFWRRHEYRFPVAMRTAEMREEYGDLAGTPTFLVTDRDGIVRERRTGVFAPGELERTIGELLQR